MVELRKRPAPKETATPAPAAKRSASKPRATGASKTASKDKKAASEKPKAASAQQQPEDKKPTKVDSEPTPSKDEPEATPKATKEAPLSAESTGTTLTPTSAALNSTIKTHADKPTTLSDLLSSSEKGIVLFTYPRASTPGCTTQACLFRDSYDPLTKAGLGVYGLSTDSPKANTTFATKQKLPYELLCDPDAIVTGPLGLKKPGNAKGTLRGVVVIEKGGNVAVWFQGGPQKTLDVVLEWIEGKK